MRETRWTDEQSERAISQVLRAGVRAAAGLIVAGGMVYLARHGRDRPSFGVFLGEPNDLRTLRGILSDIAEGRGRGLIQLGLVLLVATPVARVAVSLIAFERQRDWTYVVVTAFVLLVLVASLAGVTSWP